MTEERDSYGRRPMAAAYAQMASEARAAGRPDAAPAQAPAKAKVDPKAVRAIADIREHVEGNSSPFLVVPRGELIALLAFLEGNQASGNAPTFVRPAH